jgi:hypothetical protein
MYMTKGMRLAGMSNTDRHTVLNLNITPARSFFRLNFSARKSCPQNRYIVVRSSPTRIVLTCRIHYPYPIVIGRSILTSMVQPMVYWENATANCNRRTCEIYSQQPWFTITATRLNRIRTYTYNLQELMIVVISSNITAYNSAKVFWQLV